MINHNTLKSWIMWTRTQGPLQEKDNSRAGVFRDITLNKHVGPLNEGSVYSHNDHQKPRAKLSDHSKPAKIIN